MDLTPRMLDALHHAWPYVTAAFFAADLIARLILCVRLIYKSSPVPDTLSWLLLLLLVPVFSWVLYTFFGEHRLGSKRAAKYEHLTRPIEERAAKIWRHQAGAEGVGEGDYAHLAALATHVSGLPTLRGNQLELIGDAGDFLKRLVADIDGAQHHVHLCYYIWDPDAKGAILAEAVIRAVKRGVKCRVLVDSVGSTLLPRHALWARMKDAGVMCAESLPASLTRALFARVDLRNHRKTAVIDGAIGYCGSQNVTEENFRSRIGSRAGPWIDATVRMVGPAVQPLQITFLRDWSMDSEEKLTEPTALLPTVVPSGPSIVHVLPSGPGPRPDAIHHAFLAMLYAAREEIIMTTPYFVPDEATKMAIINAALRGVDVILVVPDVSDSSLVAAAGRSHFEDLLEAGVKVWKHRKGLLHVKAATVDRTLSMIGSANFDIRSFWLNFETTLFVYDSDFTGLVRFMQSGFLQDSRPVTLAAWRRRPQIERFWQHFAQLFGPLL